MDNNNEDYKQYLIILHENQISIKNLTAIVEKLSVHLDKMTEKQIEMLLQNGHINIVKSDVTHLNKRVEKLEKSQTWQARGIIGSLGTAVIAIVVGIIMYNIKGK